jgi:hypothetical protein
MSGSGRDVVRIMRANDLATMRHQRCPTARFLLGAIFATLLETARADDAVVGDGTPASCTEAALDDALFLVDFGPGGSGGVVSFACGAADTTIPITTARFLGTEGNVVIDGGGRITLDANESSRHFEVLGASVELRDLFLINGRAATGSGGSIRVADGASLNLVRVLLRSNRAADAGGAIAAGEASRVQLVASAVLANDAGIGGGIAARGALDIDDSLIALNTAESSDGGGVHVQGGATQVRASRFEGNAAVRGGALFARDGVTSIVDSTLRENVASADGGAVSIAASALLDTASSRWEGNLADRGGALHVDAVDEGTGIDAAIATTFARDQASQFVGNRARLGGAIHVGGVPPFRAGRVGSLDLSRTRITANQAVTGGGVHSQGYFSAIDVTIEANASSADGGGMYLAPTTAFSGLQFDVTGANRFERVVIEGNQAGGDGGGVRASNPALDSKGLNILGNHAAHGGGGLYIEPASLVLLERATIADNLADGNGGGLYVADAAFLLRIDQTTFHHNRSGSRGGQLFVDSVPSRPGSRSEVVVAASTLVGGIAQGSGPSGTQGATIFASHVSNVRIVDSILAPSDAAGCFAEFGATFASDGGNTSVASACTQDHPTDIVLAAATDLRLGDMTLHDGFALVHVPRADSPLLDRTPCGAAKADQRGRPRAVDLDGDGVARCDSGSVERQLAELPAAPAALFRDGFESR